ncbi:MAG: hypothetical protein ACTIK4_13410 [Mesonia sp.]|uniref:hypothetical protein n=1 Tax=Mesonia sp. TaxID=1960830 RepID=UPI003F9C0D7D
MGRKDIYKDAKPFTKGDPRINRKGQPKKKYSEHISDVKKKGYEAPTKTEYFDMMGLLLAMDEDDLKEFASDKTRPYWIRLIVIDLNSKNTRQRMMSDYRDWLFGKAKMDVDHTTNGESINHISLGSGVKPPEDD